MNIKQLKQEARQRLAPAGKLPAKLTFISVGVSLAAAVISGILGEIVSGYQGGDGLSGMGMASLLQTLEQCVDLAVQLGSVFWTVGLTAAIFALIRAEQADKSTLFTGFRRFGPFLRLFLLKALIVMALAIVMYMPAMLIFSMTPWAMNLETAVLTNPEILDSPEAMEALLGQMVPMLVIYGVLVLVAVLAVMYRLRFAEMFLICGWNKALPAMLASSGMTKGMVKDLIRLDLSFWWFHLGSILLLGICYLDMILELCGVSLGLPSQVSYWLCYLLYALGHLALEVYARPQVTGADAVLFNRLSVIEV